MSKLSWINKLSQDEIRHIIESVDTVLLDIDGVLIRGRTPIAGSKEAVTKLRNLGKKIGFVTNNSMLTAEQLAEGLAQLGFGTTTDEIVTPNTTLLQYLKDTNFKGHIYAVAAECPKRTLREAGYTVLEYKDIQTQRLEDKVVAVKEVSLKSLEVCSKVELVYLDLDLNLSFGALQVAQILLNHKENVKLLSGTSDDTVPFDEQMFFIATKFYIEAMEKWTKKKPISMSKPGNALKSVVTSKFKISDPGRVLMIGDNLQTDIAFGVQSGFKTCVVLTGNCRLSDIESWDDTKEGKPDYVANSLEGLCQTI